MSTIDSSAPQEGVGLWRGPGENWQAPPGERAPEAAFDGNDPVAAAVVSMQGAIDDLGRKLAAAFPYDGPTGVASGNTDASGNLWLPVYQIGAGLIFKAHRLVVEAAGYTPASPYTNASAWLGFYSFGQDVLPGGTYTGIANTMQGALKEFAPATSGGQLLPALFTDNGAQASEVRGPNHLILLVVGGPASARVTVNYQGSLRPAHGIT